MVEFVERKSMKIRESGRSTDFISPSFGHGCLYNCTYCYMKRHKPTGLTIAENTTDILEAIAQHRQSLGSKKPNQTHEKFWTYDISCNEDFALHLKHHEWIKIFSFFTNSEDIMASFATKYVNPDLLLYKNIYQFSKIRVRMSLMPHDYQQMLEPNTTIIMKRIIFINQLIEAGYDVHINFSPVIVYPGALEKYRELFEDVNAIVKDEYKDKVKAEVIFLTHNEDKHQYNLDNNLPGEHLLWRPQIQEKKKSQYGGENLRYKWKLKKQLIKEWTALHDEIIPWNTIRYIF
jgi:spore photoproduct lyase